MENASLTLAICMMIPLGMMLFVFKGQSKIIITFLLTGIFMALFAGEIDGYILSESSLTIESLTENVTPVVEEILKAIPIVFLAFLIKPDRQLLLECSVAIGLGFSLLENVYLYVESPDSTILWSLIRGFGSGLMHTVCTLAVGYAMSYVISKHKLFFTGSIAALSTSIIYHSIYNIMVQSEYSLFGILLPICTYIPLLLILKNNSERIKENGT